MFANACQIARQFTRPLVVSARQLNGDVGTGLGAFVVVNDEGWVVTAAHNLEPLRKHQGDAGKVASYNAAIAELAASEKDPNRRKNKARRIPRDPAWLTNISVWWANDGVEAAEIYAYPEVDVALCRIEPFDPASVSSYPVFINPEGVAPGRSLVKIGYPFNELDAKWDEPTSTFKITSATFPPPLFPIEGMATRLVHSDDTPEGFPVRFIETSSPGLLGQSGGPTLDSEGQVWAIQSRTVHYPLGFRPRIKEGHRQVEEHQFLNVGVGIAVETLRSVLERHGITATWSD